MKTKDEMVFSRIMRIAKRYNLVVYSHKGTAVLAIHKEQIRRFPIDIPKRKIKKIKYKSDFDSKIKIKRKRFRGVYNAKNKRDR